MASTLKSRFGQRILRKSALRLSRDSSHTRSPRAFWFTRTQASLTSFGRFSRREFKSLPHQLGLWMMWVGGMRIVGIRSRTFTSLNFGVHLEPDGSQKQSSRKSLNLNPRIPSGSNPIPGLGRSWSSCGPSSW